MNVITAILLWLGVITSPDQVVTDQMLRDNSQAIQQTYNDTAFQRSCTGGVVVFIDEDQ